MREYPAYGRAIAAHLARGDKPLAVGVVLSNRWWHLLDHIPKVCIRTDDWAPRRYELGYLQGMHVVAYWGDCEGKAFGELVLELMLSAPRMLWAFDMSGRELSADDPAHDQGIGLWAAHLAGLQARAPLVQAARSRYAHAIAADARRELEEYERIRARSGDEAAVRWSAERLGWPALVRKRFAVPQDAGAPLPA